MVLDVQTDPIHNAMLGKKVPHPDSTKFLDDDNLPPAKRLKTFQSTDGEDSIGGYDSEEKNYVPHSPKRFREEVPDSEEDDDSLSEGLPLQKAPTELESALPPVKTDKEAINEYEIMKASEQLPEDIKTRLDQRNWTRGRSSIYVDAFNLALETVLEDEGHLFDEKEMKVFEQWKELDYEAQYL